MKLSDIRRENARKLVRDNGGTTAVAARLGYKNPSFISQIVGPKPTRELTEKTARAMEAEFKLPDGALDRESSAPPAAAMPTDLVADVIRMVGTVLEGEGVRAVGPEKFASLVALAFADTMQHDGKPREGHVRTLAKLLK